MNLIEHTLLTLDFWQDNVTYEGKSMPTGTLACAALNIPDEVIAKLSQLCMPLNLYMGSLQLGQADRLQMEAARESAFQIVKLLRGIECRVNLLRFHAIPNMDLEGVDMETMVAFRDYLTQHGVFATIRASRGEDIFAACGMLSTAKQQKEKGVTLQ